MKKKDKAFEKAAMPAGDAICSDGLLIQYLGLELFHVLVEKGQAFDETAE